MIPYLTTAHAGALGDLGVAGAAIFAAWQGVKGLNAWRHERLGTRRIELAEEALTQFYQVDHAIKAIRSPIGDQSESADREAEDHETGAQKSGRDLGHVTWKRMQTHQDLMNDFYATGLKLKAFFGDELYDECMTVRRCFHRIRVAAQMLFTTPYEGYQDHAFRTRLEQDIWDMNRTDDDAIEHIMQGVLERSDAILVPYLNPKRSAR